MGKIVFCFRPLPPGLLRTFQQVFSCMAKVCGTFEDVGSAIRHRRNHWPSENDYLGGGFNPLKILVKNGNLPLNRGENNKYLKPPPSKGFWNDKALMDKTKRNLSENDCFLCFLSRMFYLTSPPPKKKNEVLTNKIYQTQQFGVPTWYTYLSPHPSFRSEFKWLFFDLQDLSILRHSQIWEVGTLKS